MSRTLAALPALLALSTLANAGIPVVEKPLSGAAAHPQAAAQPAPEAAPDPVPSVQWDLYQQVQQLQQEVRQLRGQLEVQANQIDKLKQDARSRYLDLDQRITQLNTHIAAQQAAADAAQQTAQASPVATPSTAAPVANPAAATASPATAVTAAPNPDDEKKAYFSAYEVFKSGGPNKAIGPMRNFIKTYPQSSYTPGAYYWLGEFYLAASPADLVNARKSFRIVVDQFPDTPKAPAAMVKLASLADNDNKTPEAIKYMLDVLKRFPGTPEAAMARGYLKEHDALPPEKDKSKSKSDGKGNDKSGHDKSAAKSQDGHSGKSPEKSKP